MEQKQRTADVVQQPGSGISDMNDPHQRPPEMGDLAQAPSSNAGTIRKIDQAMKEEEDRYLMICCCGDRRCGIGPFNKKVRANG